MESACNALAKPLLGRGHFPPAEVDVAEVVMRRCERRIAVECLEVADARFSVLAALPIHNSQVVVRASVVWVRRQGVFQYGDPLFLFVEPLVQRELASSLFLLPSAQQGVAEVEASLGKQRIQPHGAAKFGHSRLVVAPKVIAAP